MIDRAPLGIARLSLDGRFLSGNPALCTMLGCTEGELRQLRDADVTQPEDLEPGRQAHADVVERRRPLAVVEKRYVRKDGSAFWAELTVAPVLDRTGEVRCLVSLVRDVSHRREGLGQAAELQGALLPTGAPPLDGYELAARCVPAADVGGDFFDWYMSAPGELTVTLGDVMGKGMSAALLMATVRSALRAGARSGSLTEPLRLASDTIALDFEHSDTFVTLLHARLSQRTGRLSYVDAGHGYTFLLAPDGEVRHLRSQGLPLAVLPGQTYHEAVTELRPGMTFVAFSDGVAQLHPALAVRLDALTEILAGARTAEEVVRRLTRGAAHRPAQDDVTVLALRRAPGRRTSLTVGRSRTRQRSWPN